MVIGDVNYRDPTVHAPPWHLLDDPTALMGRSVPVSGVTCRANNGAFSPYLLGEAALAALRRLVPPPPSPQPQQHHDECYDSDESSGADSELYACDEFRMYDFKVLACRRRRSHNWTECPFAHPGEKAARRDPRRFSYSGEPCPEFRRRGACERGDGCDLAHGVFECWLHPARYRTQPCKDGTACRRPVCFFAHTLDQLRVLAQPPKSYDGAPTRRRRKEKINFSSPPMSPPAAAGNRRDDAAAAAAAAMAELRLCKSMPSSWKYRSNAAEFASSSSSSVRSTVMVERCFEDSVDEESAEEEMSMMPNFDWVSELVK